MFQDHLKLTQQPRITLNFFFFFTNRVSLHNPDFPGTPDIGQGRLEIRDPPSSVSGVLGEKVYDTMPCHLELVIFLLPPPSAELISGLWDSGNVTQGFIQAKQALYTRGCMLSSHQELLKGTFTDGRGNSGISNTALESAHYSLTL